MKYLLVYATALIALSCTARAQIQSAQSGSFTDTSTWVGGVVPTTGTFNVNDTHIVTADSGTVWNSAGSGFNVFGTLNINTGASLTSGTGRLNDGSPTTTGIVNINGGSLSVNRIFASSATGNITVNLFSGSLSVTSAATTLSGGETINVSGGTMILAGSLAGTTKFNMTGGSSVINGLSRWGSINTWTGGTITTNNSTSMNSSGMAAFIDDFNSSSTNIWNLSSLSAKQTFSYTNANSAYTVTSGTIEFDVYSATANDNDLLSLTNGSLSKIMFSSNAHFNINDVNLSGTAASYIGSTYQLLNFSATSNTYTGVLATLDPAVWNIGGQDYNVGFTNNLATNGSITVASLTAVPESSTFGLVTLALVGIAGLRRRRAV